MKLCSLPHYDVREILEARESFLDLLNFEILPTKGSHCAKSHLMQSITALS